MKNTILVIISSLMLIACIASGDKVDPVAGGGAAGTVAVDGGGAGGAGGQAGTLQQGGNAGSQAGSGGLSGSDAGVEVETGSGGSQAGSGGSTSSDCVSGACLAYAKSGWATICPNGGVAWSCKVYPDCTDAAGDYAGKAFCCQSHCIDHFWFKDSEYCPAGKHFINCYDFQPSGCTLISQNSESSSLCCDNCPPY